MPLLLKLVVYSILVTIIRATCDVCQKYNHVACHSRNRFSLCIDGQATHDFITCPENSICTSDVLVCYPQHTVTRHICERNDILRYPSSTVNNLCGVCDENKVFACLNETTIAFCFGADEPTEESLSYCPKGTVCDISRESGFCSERDLVEPSCITSHKEPRDPNEICQDDGSTGSYKTDDDTTCTKFVLCYAMNGELHGLENICPNGQFFHPDKGLCADDILEGCSTLTDTTSSTAGSTSTTPLPAEGQRDPNKICQDAGSTGSYKTDDDVTCTKFVVCYLSGGKLQGLQKSCPPDQYFHTEIRLCVTEKPEGCQ